MFANRVEETCTGTGDTLSLTGATSGHRTFAQNFSDGDFVSYFLVDSGGTIEVGGIGTFNTGSPNTITRRDLYHWNGTVVAQKPATNPTLSGGTHTIRCELIAEAIGCVNSSGQLANIRSSTGLVIDSNAFYSTTTRSGFANRVYFTPFTLDAPELFSGMAIEVIATDAAATMGLALYHFISGDDTAQLIEACPNFTPSTAQLEVCNFSANRFLRPGRYLLAQGQNTSVPSVSGYNATNGVAGLNTKDATPTKNIAGWYKDGEFSDTAFSTLQTGLDHNSSGVGSYPRIALVLA